VKEFEKFKKDLRSGKIYIGTSITFNDPLITYALADSVDFVWIEIEHCIMNPETLSGHILAGRSKDLPVLVRVAGSDTVNIKPVLDSGAGGIIVPQVKSADEVRRIVNDCRYKPLGNRGFGPRIPSNFDRNSGKEYIDEANKNIFVAVMIENVEAVENIDEIIKIPGLDSLIIGPSDLSHSLNIPGETKNKKLLSIIDKIISKTIEAGLTAGIGVSMDYDFITEMIKKGVQIFQVGNDFHYMINYADQLVSQIRKRIKDI